MARPALAPLTLAFACLLAALGALVGDGHAEAAPTPASSATPARDLPPGADFPDPGPSRIVYPPQSINLRFDHRAHLAAGKGLTCLSCHGAASRSVSAGDRLLPPPALCDTCHGSDHTNLLAVTAGAGENGACADCHVGYRAGDGNAVAKTLIPTPHLRSNHKAHADRNIGCESCHGAVQDIGLATRDQLGRMRGCFGCHALAGPNRGAASNACPTCHLDQPGGVMQVAFREGKMLPPRWMGGMEHTADFLTRHKRVAGADSAACAACHTEDYCTDCHDGRVRPRDVHPNDYLSLHPTEARLDNPHCGSCHQEQQFCIPCHQRSGVAWTGSPGNVRAQGRFHPPPSVWVNPPRTREHHASEAERNLNACVSCHTERDCAICHASRGAGGQGFSPHPPGFASQCGSAARKNPRPCLVCHEPGDALLARCR